MRAFTLTEVMLAIAVLGVALAAIMPALPVGMRNVSNTTESSRAMDLLEAIRTDIVIGLQSDQALSPRYAIPLESEAPVFLEVTGTGSPAAAGSRARYRIRVAFTPAAPDSLQPHFWHLRATWPAAAPAGKELGSVELTAARTMP